MGLTTELGRIIFSSSINHCSQNKKGNIRSEKHAYFSFEYKYCPNVASAILPTSLELIIANANLVPVQSLFLLLERCTSEEREIRGRNAEVILITDIYEESASVCFGSEGQITHPPTVKPRTHITN
jgi:hypothetical protein